MCLPTWLARLNQIMMDGYLIGQVQAKLWYLFTRLAKLKTGYYVCIYDFARFNADLDVFAYLIGLVKTDFSGYSTWLVKSNPNYDVCLPDWPGSRQSMMCLPTYLARLRQIKTCLPTWLARLNQIMMDGYLIGQVSDRVWCVAAKLPDSGQTVMCGHLPDRT